MRILIDCWQESVPPLNIASTIYVSTVYYNFCHVFFFFFKSVFTKYWALIHNNICLVNFVTWYTTHSRPCKMAYFVTPFTTIMNGWCKSCEFRSHDMIMWPQIAQFMISRMRLPLLYQKIFPYCLWVYRGQTQPD